MFLTFTKILAVVITTNIARPVRRDDDSHPGTTTLNTAMTRDSDTVIPGYRQLLASYVRGAGRTC